MGTLLLQGWAMLEECCETCSVPLMRSRQKDKEICVQCGKDYMNPGASNDKKKEVKETDKPSEEAAAARLEQEKQDILRKRREERERADQQAALAKLEQERQDVLRRRKEEMMVAQRAQKLMQEAKKQREIVEKVPLPEVRPEPEIESKPQRQTQPQPEVFGQDQVLIGLIKKQMQLTNRMESEQDLTQISRYIQAISDIQTLIERITPKK